jgi:hypothetical protein
LETKDRLQTGNGTGTLLFVAVMWMLSQASAPQTSESHSMRMKIGVATLAVLAGLAASAAQATETAPAGKAVDALRAGTLPVSYAQFRPGYGGWHRGGWHRGGFGGWRGGYGYGYRRGPGVGAAVGAGLLGFAAGTVIGSAAASSAARPVAVYGTPAPVVYARPVVVRGSAYCASRYASYDPASSTYLGSDGFRHPCP